MQIYAGADLGGTNFRVGIRAVGTDRLLGTASTPALGTWSPADVVEQTGALLHRALLTQGLDRTAVQALGFGVTGDINPFAGTCHSMKRFPGLEGVALASLLEDELRMPARILNDGLAATLAELRAGVGRETRDFVLITLGTGIGGGLVMDGRLVLGSAGRVGKAGHQIIEAEGPVHCHCGLRGCWQSLAGKEGVVARARAYAARFPESALTAAARSGEVDLQHLTELAHAGDEASRLVLEETGRYVGIGIANLVKILAPERVVIGGGIAERNELLMAAVQRTVREYAIKPYQDRPVVPAVVGKDAGVLGATYLAEGLPA